MVAFVRFSSVMENLQRNVRIGTQRSTFVSISPGPVILPSGVRITSRQFMRIPYELCNVLFLNLWIAKISLSSVSLKPPPPQIFPLLP